MGSSLRPIVPNYLTPASVVRELARAADIVDKVKRKTPTTKMDLRKDCEKAVRILNQAIADAVYEKKE